MRIDMAINEVPSLEAVASTLGFIWCVQRPHFHLQCLLWRGVNVAFGPFAVFPIGRQRSFNGVREPMSCGGLPLLRIAGAKKRRRRPT